MVCKSKSSEESFFCEAPLFPARGTWHKLLNNENHDDQEEERAHDDDREVKEEKS